MRYKVGDKVKVRKDLVVGNFYKMNDTNDMHLYHSYLDMEKGRVLTIKEVLDNKYKVEENIWYWADEMFELLEEQ